MMKNSVRSKRISKQLLPCLLILLQSFLYGFGDPVSKVAYEAMPVFSLLTVRYLIAFVVLCFIGGRDMVGELKTASVKAWLPPSLCIACCYVISNIALKLTAATSVAFLRSMSTIMTPLLSSVFFGKRYGWKHVLIQILVLVGLYLLCGYGGLSGFGWGEVLALISALLMAGTLLFGQNALRGIRPLTLTTVQAAASAFVAGICAILFDGGFDISSAAPVVWGIILYLALACTAAGYLLQNTALRSISAKTVALLQCACPVMTALFSFLILSEHMSAVGLIGAGILLLCVAAEILIGEDSEKQNR